MNSNNLVGICIILVVMGFVINGIIYLFLLNEIEIVQGQNYITQDDLYTLNENLDLINENLDIINENILTINYNLDVVENNLTYEIEQECG